jgi:DNA-binding NtrC family response regulator
VILDLSMPKMDGRRALAELQRIRPGVKVLLASGYGETEMAGHQAGEKPAGFLQKPFASEDLETAIRKVLGCEE